MQCLNPYQYYHSLTVQYLPTIIALKDPAERKWGGGAFFFFLQTESKWALNGIILRPHLRMRSSGICNLSAIFHHITWHFQVSTKVERARQWGSSHRCYLHFCSFSFTSTRVNPTLSLKRFKMADNSDASPVYAGFFGVMGASAAIIFSCKFKLGAFFTQQFFGTNL